MYGIGCITLAFIYDVGVDLGSFYGCMSKHSLDGIDIRVMFKLQGGEGVTGTIAQFKQKQRKVKMGEMNCKWLRMSNIS